MMIYSNTPLISCIYTYTIPLDKGGARLVHWPPQATGGAGDTHEAAARGAHSLPVCLSLLALPAATTAAECQFILGFATLKALIDAAEGPDKVGDCLENQRFNPENGDALQQTTGGLLVWRKADNWTAFTDGHRTWINGPHGLQARLNTETIRLGRASNVAGPDRRAARERRVPN